MVVEVQGAVRSVRPWRGLHHLALVTPDLDATVRFYRDVLGMGVGEIVERAGVPRACWVGRVGGDGWGVHFFELRDAALFTERPKADFAAFAGQGDRLLRGEGDAAQAFLPGALQHVAFALPDETAALALRERPRAHDVPTTAVYGQGGALGFFLCPDNNGIVLEAVWPG